MISCKVIKLYVAFMAFSFWETAASAETNVFYDVYRAVSGGAVEFLESVLAPATTYTDPTVSSGETYNYWVRVREADVQISKASISSLKDTWQIEIAVPLKVVENENFPVDVSAAKTETGLISGDSVTLEFVEENGLFSWESEVVKSVTTDSDLSRRWWFRSIKEMV